jgi:PAS domain S-box-containing protein
MWFFTRRALQGRSARLSHSFARLVRGRLSIRARGLEMKRPASTRKTEVGAEHEIVLLAAAAAMFAWIMRAVLDFYFSAAGQSFADALVLDVAPRELYSRVAVASAFLISGTIISRTVQKMRVTETRSRHLGKCVRSVRAVNQLITRETDPDALCNVACAELAQGMGYASVEILTGGVSRGLCVTSTAESSTRAEQEPDRVSIPIACSGDVFGELRVVFGGTPADDQEEHDLLREVAEDIAFAIRSIEVSQELSQQREELQTILDSISAYISYRDRDGNYVRVNRALAEAAGIPHDALSGGALGELVLGTDAGSSPADFEVIESGKPKCGLFETLELPSGTRWIRTDRVPHRDSSGDVVGVIALSIDMTERLEAEQELSRKEEQLRQAQKMEAIGQLAGGVAHDFNNLLTAISGYTEMALASVDPEHPASEMLRAVAKSSERAAALTGQLLAFSRKQPLSLAKLDVNDIIRDMSDLLRRLIGENIDFAVEPGGEACEIKGDKSQIEQIIMNVAVNARDAMPHGGRLVIATRRVTIAEDDCVDNSRMRAGPCVCISVRDTGDGMEERTLHQIFEPFFTTKRSRGGTGLGLSVVYGIVEQHGGWVQVDSELGHGTTFHIFLPTVEEQRNVVQEPEGLLGGSGTIPPRGSGERVLLVEDEDSVRTFAARALREWGYEVVLASDAEEALNTFTEDADGFDLIFSDIVLPGRSGTDLAQDIYASRPGQLVLLSSGYLFPEGAACDSNGWLSEHVRLLQKPYSAMGLRLAIHEALVS